MKVLSALFVAGVALVAQVWCVAADQSKPAFAGLGVCAISPNRISCWDMSGKLSGKLSQRVQDSLERDPVDLWFQPEETNRYLVLSKEDGAIRAMVSLKGSSGGHTVPVGQAETPTLVPVVPNPGQTTATARITVDDLPHSHSVDLRFRQREKTVIDGADVEIGEIRQEERPVPNAPFVPFIVAAKAWSVVVGADSADGRPSLDLTPIGWDGKPISYVDANGRSVSEKVFKDWSESEQHKQAQATGEYKYAFARFTTLWGQQFGAQIYYFNVDPDAIKSLRVTKIKTETQEIAGFPLDPR